MSTDTGAAASTTNPPSGESTTDQPVTTAETTDASKTFTSSEVEGIVKSRLQRYAAKYADYDDLKVKAAEVETQRLAQMSETEKAIEVAKETGRQEASQKFAKMLAAAEVKSALATIVDDPDEVVSDLDLAKYVNEDGTVNTEAVTALKTKWTKMVGTRRTVSTGHGRNGGTDAPSTKEEKFAVMMNELFEQSQQQQ